MIESSHEQNCRRYQTEMQGQRERRGARQQQELDRQKGIVDDDRTQNALSMTCSR